MARTEGTEGRMHHKLTRSLAKKALAPLAASAAAYAAKKLPQLYEEKIAPKLRERGGARATVQDAVESVGTQVQNAKGAIADKTESLPVPSVSTSSGNGGDSSKDEQTDAEREEARQKRQQNRQARRKAST